MPDWLKTVALIVGLSGWLATVAVSLLQGKLPDPATLGIPAALVIAIAPPVTIRRARAKAKRRAVEAPDEGTDEA